MELVWPIAYVGSLCLAICAFALAFFNGLRMLSEVTAKGHAILNLVPFLLGVVPGTLTDAGERFRKRYATSLLSALGFGGLAGVIYVVKGL